MRFDVLRQFAQQQQRLARRAYLWQCREPPSVAGAAARRVALTPVGAHERFGPLNTRRGGSSASVDVLSSRILLHPRDLRRSRRFYRDVLGLAVYREFGDPSDRSVVFFLGGGFLEVSGSSGQQTDATSIALWLQVRDVED